METSLQKKFETELESFVAEIQADCNTPEGKSVATLRGITEALAGGKRIRPLLLFNAYQGYGGVDIAAVMPAAVALELLHTFALIHDDLIDEAARRRNRPSLHRYLAATLPGTGLKAGQDLAMLTGDILFAAAIESFLHTRVPPTLRDEALRALTVTARSTGHGVYMETALRGQPLESIDEASILAIAEEKTAHYTFACPLQVGALLAGAPVAEQQRITACARLWGLAYQIRDDINDLQAFLDDRSDAPKASELRIMLPLHLALRQASAETRLMVDKATRCQRAAKTQREQLASLISMSKGMEKAEEYVQNYLAKAEELATSLSMDAQCLDELRKRVKQFFATTESRRAKPTTKFPPPASLKTPSTPRKFMSVGSSAHMKLAFPPLSKSFYSASTRRINALRCVLRTFAVQSSCFLWQLLMFKELTSRESN